MGCDIHLRLEIKLKKDKVWNQFYTENCGEWKNARILGDETWGDRIYGMFAALADVRNYHKMEHLTLRGIPKDCCNKTLAHYGLRVIDQPDEKCSEGEVSADDAEKWVKLGYSYFYTLNGYKFVSDPDWHTPNWCTTQEMESCINNVFRADNGTYEGDYIEWLALLGAMKGYEQSGEYECRAVFWFDN